MRQSGKTLAAMQATITDLPALGLDAVQGIQFTDSWYWDLNDRSRAWSQRLFKERKAMPSAYQAGTASAIGRYLRAVRDAGTTDTKQVREKVRATPVDHFFTSHGVICPDGRMVHDR